MSRNKCGSLDIDKYRHIAGFQYEKIRLITAHANAHTSAHTASSKSGNPVFSKNPHQRDIFRHLKCKKLNVAEPIPDAVSEVKA